jgi:hypothetical protein
MVVLEVTKMLAAEISIVMIRGTCIDGFKK